MRIEPYTVFLNRSPRFSSSIHLLLSLSLFPFCRYWTWVELRIRLLRLCLRVASMKKNVMSDLLQWCSTISFNLKKYVRINTKEDPLSFISFVIRSLPVIAVWGRSFFFIRKIILRIGEVDLWKIEKRILE